jgi:hypothetical protein
MRSYSVQITPVGASSPIVFNSQSTLGVDNYSCLRLDLDIYQTWYHQPAGNSHIKLWGVDLKDLGQKASLNPERINGTLGYNYAGIQIGVGMSKGLPFAQPTQAGLIVKGSILQSFSTWQGTEVGLDIVLIPAQVNPNAPANITLSWKKKEQLTTAVINALKNAYGADTQVFGSFSPDLVYTEDTGGQYSSFISFARKIQQISKDINKSPSYAGASITNTTKGFLLSDATVAPTGTKQIAFTDVIGNLTWLDIATIQARVTMRGDLNVGDYITFEQAIPVNNVINNNSQFRNNLAFQGVFMINKLHHIGSSRQPNGNSWVTVIDAVFPNMAF